jgi:cell division cycle protein 37
LGDTWREAAWVVEGAKVEAGVVKKDGKKVDESTGQPKWADEHLPPDGKVEKMGSVLAERLEWHLKELAKRDGEVEKEIAKEEAEQKKKITSEDITEGFSATSHVKGSAPSPIENKGIKEPKKSKKKEEVIEVLNPGAVSCLSRSISVSGKADPIDLII